MFEQEITLALKVWQTSSMSEKRKPHVTLLVRRGASRRARKVEVFHGASFSGRGFQDLVGAKAEDAAGHYRVRVDGVWTPRNSKVLYSAEEVDALILQFIGVSRS